NLMPLSKNGLWLADSTAAGQRRLWLRYAAPGVGRTPASTTPAPSAASPAASAASSIGPDRRVSRASTNGRSAPSTRAAARPSASASSGVSSTLARPRTPSVPKRSVTGRPARRLPLRVLRRLAGLLQAVLLAFLLPGVAGQQPRLLHRGPEVGIERHEGPGDPEPQRPGLPAHPAAGQRAVDVVHLGRLGEPERFGHDHPVRGVREEVLERPLVALDHPGTGAEPHPGHRFLAPSGGLDEGLRHFRGLLRRSGAAPATPSAPCGRRPAPAAPASGRCGDASGRGGS